MVDRSRALTEDATVIHFRRPNVLSLVQRTVSATDGSGVESTAANKAGNITILLVSLDVPQTPRLH